MRKNLLGVIIIFAAAAGFLFFWKSENILLLDSDSTVSLPVGLLQVPEAQIADKLLPQNKNQDIGPQKPLPNPPQEIKAVYLTSWSAGSQKKIDSIIDFIKSTGLNAVVIDVKDYSGYVAYDIKFPDVDKYKAKEIRMPRINALIKKLHDEEIYVIARVTIFQDPILAKARPDLAVQSKAKLMTNNRQPATSTLWLDYKGLAWMDPGAKEVWDYNIGIAKETAGRGFDEINFDYIRFPSDGDLKDTEFPFHDEKLPERETIRNFFEYLRKELDGTIISADLFGLSTIHRDDLGIGQVIEDAYAYFDYVAPMTYPSHYAPGFLGFKNPAQYPYEVVKYSMESALQRLRNYESGITNNGTTTASTVPIQNSSFKIHNSKLRPWLQDFDLGAIYNKEMIEKQVNAVYDAFCAPNQSEASTSTAPGANIVISAKQQCATSSRESSDEFGGWMFWNPSNIYEKEKYLFQN